jgi:D-alanyl-D-alanine carboxypeptidase
MWIRTLLFAAWIGTACAQLAPSVEAAIDRAAGKTLSETGVPSASIAVVKDGKVAYVRAYGDARLEPRTPAQPGMRYKIASNSKQITASAILMLVEEGKLSLDDHVSRFFPDLTRANEITIRRLLSHTSGYQDYYPLDYVAPFMARPISPQGILDTWARKPLDFSPGSQWQYSNTNYTITGLIVEKITGHPLIDFLRARIFQPLGMLSPIDVDRTPWSSADPDGYTRNALGPARSATPEGAGWMFAAGELAMTAADLALWDISLMNGSLLKHASLEALTTEVRLKNGAGAGYALGLGVSNVNGHRKWSHGGGANGFVSENFILPDDKISVAVLTNQDDPAAHRIAAQIERLLLPPPSDPQDAASLDRARRLFSDLQHGKLDRALLTDDANAYFSPQVIDDYTASLKSLGPPTSFTQTDMALRGGMTTRTFSIQTAGRSLQLVIFEEADGRVAQYKISPASSR